MPRRLSRRDETTSMRRLVMAALTGGVVAIMCALVGPWQLTVVSGWSAASVTFLVVAWAAIFGADGATTERLSTVEDDDRITTGLLLLAASTASLVGVGLALHRASNVEESQRVVLTVVALATIVLSWLVVNTVFTLRYAHLYFSRPVGGIEFPGSDQPEYRDFAYLAFTVGMTYQVSDTGLRSPKFRHTVLGHAVLSYLFGTVIVATSINVVAGFAR